MDFLVAGLLLLFLAPIMLLLAFVVRLTSRGPALFRQKRLGRNGSQFAILKFRTMRLEHSNNGSNITEHEDPRLTAVGRFLRRRKLDELPQFLNVLWGEMSLAGPRPRVESQRQDPALLVAKPGVTSPATLAFRHEHLLLKGLAPEEIGLFYSEVVVPTKVRLDLYYLRNASFSLDLRLIWQTFLSIVTSQYWACFSSRDQLVQASGELLDALPGEHSPLAETSTAD